MKTWNLPCQPSLQRDTKHLDGSCSMPFLALIPVGAPHSLTTGFQRRTSHHNYSKACSGRSLAMKLKCEQGSDLAATSCRACRAASSLSAVMLGSTAKSKSSRLVRTATPARLQPIETPVSKELNQPLRHHHHLLLLLPTWLCG